MTAGLVWDEGWEATQEELGIIAIIPLVLMLGPDECRGTPPNENGCLFRVGGGGGPAKQMWMLGLGRIGS